MNRHAWAMVAALLWAVPTWAGQSCQSRPADAATVVQASQAAVAVYRTLEQRAGRVALVARAGTDLSDYGLDYSHVALAVRDHPSGPWTLVHLLNHCGRGDSALYRQGLVNFFLDDVHRFDALVITLAPTLQRALLNALESGLDRALHEPRYNLIAHPRSRRYQNSNQWLLELLAAAAERSGPGRQAAQAALFRGGYRPDRIRIGRFKRLVGGITQPHLDFLDHPLGDRLRSRYEVVTVRSIVHWLEDREWVVERLAVDAPMAWRAVVGATSPKGTGLRRSG